MKQYFVAALCVAVLAVSACRSVTKDAEVSGMGKSQSILLFEQPGAVKTAAGDVIDFREFRIDNNLWNVSGLKAGTYSQSIYYRADGGTTLFGWKWSYPSGGVNAYPEIIYGWKPWYGASTTTALPRQIGSIQSLKVNYSADIVFSRSGSSNLAFDLWISSAPGQPTGATVKFEFMIWENQWGLSPFGAYRETVATSDGQYKFYMGEPTWEPEGFNWTYLAFVRTESRQNGTVDIDELLRYLVNAGIVPNDYFLSTIEFGNEAGGSAASAVFDKYEIVLDGALSN